MDYPWQKKTRPPFLKKEEEKIELDYKYARSDLFFSVLQVIMPFSVIAQVD